MTKSRSLELNVKDADREKALKFWRHYFPNAYWHVNLIGGEVRYWPDEYTQESLDLMRKEHRNVRGLLALWKRLGEVKE